MIRLVQRRLIVPRGDTGTFSIPILAGKDSGDAAIFTVFDPLMHRKIFEKAMTLSDGALGVDFTHNDTVNLPVGQYVWDIKFYTDPLIVDGKLVGGTEVDSYYSAFTLPICEIRETGDNLLMSDDAPTGALRPGQVDIITASIREITSLKESAAESAANADTSATNAESSASAAATSAQDALDSKIAALAAQQTASAASESAQSAAEQAQASATLAAQRADEVMVELGTKANIEDLAAVAFSGLYSDLSGVPTRVSQFINDAGYLTQHQDISGKANLADLATVAISGSYNDLENKPTIPQRVSDLQDDSGHYTKPVTGIPASDLEETYLTSFTETDPTVPAWAKEAIKPSYTPQEVGALPADTFIPSKVSDLTDDSGHYTKPTGGIPASDLAETYLTQHQDISMKANSADLATVATSGSYEDLSNKPTIPDIQINWNSIVDNGIANIPLAANGAVGLVQGNNTYGTAITAAGDIMIYRADDSAIKNGNGEYKPIVPYTEHQAVFYGLAKAAGDTTQKVSTNAVGTYTNEAKAAIQTMLNVPSNTDLALKADKTDTVLETTLSRGRKDNTTVGGASLAFGIDTEASGYYSVALGLNTTASSQGAFAEGKNTVAHYIAHAEGENSQALSSWSHAQNVNTIANGGASSASGRSTIANGADSFVFGRYNAADSYGNWPTWVANTSYEVGDRVKRNLMVQNQPTDVGYHCTVANSDATFDNAHWELDGYHMNYVEIVGNGKEYEDPETHQTVRAGSNAYALEWNGTARYMGDVYVGANADSTGGTRLATITEVAAKLDAAEAGLKVVRLI